jgi:hypothetical protein
MAHRSESAAPRDDKGGGGASIWDRLLGSQVSNARPGAPFDFTLRHCGEHKLCHFSPDSLSASRLLLGMTKGAVALPFGIGCWDPRSQTRDLGHPSISPFDIAEGTSFVISLPTRLSESASLGMTRRELGFTGNWLHGFQVSNGAEPGGIAYSRSLSRATCVRR